MPTPPVVWSQQDYFSANRLNSELYRLLGQYFSPNGIGFHAQRPVYKAYYPSGMPTASVGTTFAALTAAGLADNWNVVGDTSGWLGWRGDQANRGWWGLSGLGYGGGAGGSSAGNGGLALMTNAIPFGTTGAPQVYAAIGDSSFRIQGTCQQLNAANVSAPWALDIVDSNNAGAVLSVWGAISAGTGNAAASTDGSQWAIRQHAFWASVYPANGSTVASLPTPATNWTSSSPVLTAAYMNGLTGIGAVTNLLNMPPLLRAVGLGNGTVTVNGATTTCAYGTATYDTYSGYNTSTHTYTVPLNGIYLVYNTFPFDLPGVAQSGGTSAGVSINGTAYWGPTIPFGSGTTGNVGAAKVQVFSLNAGDTIKPIVVQNSGGGFTGSAGRQGCFIVLFLGMQGVPSPLPLAPDPSFTWAAGTPASQMPGLMNSHFANDLNFLTKRPYLLGYQAVAQANVAQNGNTPVTIDTIQGIVHADTGDNYSGWGSGVYTAQRYGWYLAVQETYMIAPTLNVSPMNVAGFNVVPSGSYATDFYQGANANGSHCGAAAVGIYHLRPGDTIAPIVRTENTAAGNSSTFVASGFNPHFEVVWLGE